MIVACIHLVPGESTEEDGELDTCGASIIVNVYRDSDGADEFTRTFLDGEIVDQECECELTDAEQDAVIAKACADYQGGGDWYD